MERLLRKEVAQHSFDTAPPERIVIPEDLEELPEPAQRYLRFSGSVGKPLTWSFLLGMSGRFRTGPDRKWAGCRTLQYNTMYPITRVFLLRVRMGGLPVTARDTYAEGKGHMVARLLSIVKVVDEEGPEMNMGEFVTYLNDLVLLAPSALLAHNLLWKERDAGSFEITLRDHGLSVTGTVFVDNDGVLRDFSTTDRFYAGPRKTPGPRFVRSRWSTPVSEYGEVEGWRLPLRAKAVWHLESGDFTYADFTIDRIKWNLTAGQVE